MSDSLIGKVVDGRYAITALIGRGGMATVYRARDKRLERDIAIKLMHPHLAEKSDLNTRFNKEARAAAQLSNPHVVAIHDQGVWASPEGPRAYLVMEYVPGPDLRSELQRLGSLSLGSCLDITEHVLRALAAAHEAGIIHRDVKPENILLTNPLPSDTSGEGAAIQAKVADFGLAHVIDAESAGTGTILGTVAYIPPESVSSGIFEPPADLYALGIMMYEAITGQLPFKGETPMQTAYMHITKPMPKVADKAEWIPPEVDSFIADLTAKEPSDRPANGKEALEQFLAMRDSIDEASLARRIPVAPSIPQTSINDASEEPYQEKTVAYSHTSSLPVPTEPSPPETITSIAAAEEPSPALATDTPTEALPGTVEKAKFATATTTSKKKTRKRLLIILLVLALLAAAVGGWYFFAGPGKRVSIPAVAGQSAEAGKKKLTDAGFVVDSKEAYSDDVEKGLVISTTPSNKRLRIGSTVTMTVSLGIEQVEVPAVVSLPREEALTKVEGARLHPKVTESYSDDVEKDLVISQSLEGGSIVNHDSDIEIVISLGREPVELPTLTNMGRDEAVQALEAVGLHAAIAEEFSDTVPAGKVMAQNPSEGTVYRGDTISFTLSKGPPVVQVPKVTRLSVQEARSKLEAAGLKVDEKPLFGDLEWGGTVYRQDPKAGQTVKIGSTVTIGII
ncbi:MAG: Stk1 family PASTA domain-containing Ser/Thr kinase [Actinomycetaceae bacterium]|nr:Stk1 family PASTA domain-containing Ser/Thr kinase [Actinomycetaceae bacterium]